MNSEEGCNIWCNTRCLPAGGIDRVTQAVHKGQPRAEGHPGRLPPSSSHPAPQRCLRVC